jgi:hypothetical protein
LGQIVWFSPRRATLDPKTQYISVYIKHMADELAELAEYAGCSHLATLFALASIEAENHPPVAPLTRYPTASSNNAIKRPKLRTLPWKPKARQVISGMDAVDKIKKGAKEDGGAVTVPDKIAKMQLAADAASGKK